MTAGDAGFVAAVVLIALVGGRVSRILLRALIGFVASRAITGANSRWRTRIPRVLAETIPVAELRRRQRINSLALVLSRIVQVCLLVAAVLVILQRFDADVVVALSSVGFLIAAVTVGAQDSIRDYIAGIHALLEDRYGEGDEIRVTLASGTLMEGRVDSLGSFSTRVAGPAGTSHLPNRLLTEVTNLSQRPVLGELTLPGEVSSRSERARVASVISSAVRSVLNDSNAGVVVEGTASRDNLTFVTVRFDRELSDDELAAVENAAQAKLTGA